MTAVRRTAFKISGALVAAIGVSLGVPASAQNADAPVDVTAAPPATAETVGPSQLRDFNLNGTVTRAADRPSAVSSAPAERPAASPARPAQQPEAANVPAANIARTSPSSGSAAVPNPGRSAVAEADIASDEVTPSTPASVATDLGPEPALVPAPVTGLDDSPAEPATSHWPWIAVLLAALGGAAFFYLSRQRRERYGDPGRMAFAGLAPDPGAEPIPFPPARPRAAPTPKAEPRPAPGPSPSPRSPAPKPAPAPAPAGDGLIVSTRLKPRIDVDFVPDRVVVTDQEVLLQFDVIVANGGSAPARDVLVEARLVAAHAQQDQEIGTFFQNPVGKGDRIPAIQPLGRLALKSAVRLPLDQLHAFEVEGRKLFVPLVAFNILFNGSEQTSASFLVGRGGSEDEKLAPFRLDLGPRIFRGLAARPHSMGLSG
jgi:hypothetical protein